MELLWHFFAEANHQKRSLPRHLPWHLPSAEANLDG